MSSAPPWPSLDTLIVVLQRMPMLVRLDLKDVLKRREPYEITCHTFAQLPCLEAFLYTGTHFPQDHALVSHIHFPAQTQVKFYSKSFKRRALGDDFPQVLSTFARVRTSEEITTQSMNFHYEDFDHTLTLAWIVTPSSDPEYPSPSVSTVPSPGSIRTTRRPQLHIDPPSASSITQKVFDTPDLLASGWIPRINALPLNSLEVFRTNVEVTPGSLWTNVFQSMPNLRDIFLEGSSGVFLLQHLVDSHPTSTMTPSILYNGTTLPCLREIHLTKTNYKDYPVQLHSLAHVLAERKLYGSPVRLISFTAQECRASEQFQGLVEELKAVVEAVGWDGSGI
ncbi:hypothetical protein BDN72DRAFT_847167 [Pluteus cervinus]|uniref:Uncharacterized protein n=1 Tax=Pluteus cervinus TaxID=181527 RepID=A0ACD3AE20_9AGAR|nr:hypothetical protein BDN72DRAFT_847167 [Pluteus cervinus]